MASSPPKAVPSAPVLSSKIHHGVPGRLVREAASAKERLYSNKTVGESKSRRRASPLPPNLSREAYDEAIAELRQSLGEANVELNDKPLVDGWYMEHPSVPRILFPHLELIGLQQYPRRLPHCRSGRAGLQCRSVPIHNRRGAVDSAMGQRAQDPNLSHLDGT